MDVETLILGAGAAGLFCAGRAGPGTLLIDHAKAPGEKIRISGLIASIRGTKVSSPLLFETLISTWSTPVRSSIFSTLFIVILLCLL